MTEMLIICAVALLVFGPNELPQVAKKIAKGLREVRKVSDDFKRSIDFDDDDDKPAKRPLPRDAEVPAERQRTDLPASIAGSRLATEAAAEDAGHSEDGALNDANDADDADLADQHDAVATDASSRRNASRDDDDDRHDRHDRHDQQEAKTKQVTKNLGPESGVPTIVPAGAIAVGSYDDDDDDPSVPAEEASAPPAPSNAADVIAVSSVDRMSVDTVSDSAAADPEVRGG